MTTFYLLLLVFAFVCFVLSAFGLVVRRIDLVAVGLACWVLYTMLKILQHI